MYENDEIEIDLSRVFEIIKKHFKPFALIVLAASIVAALITLFLIPKKYTAEAKLIIVQKSNPDSQQISYNDLQTSQKLVNTYSEILKSEAISDEVIQNLKLEDLDTEGYQKIVKISSVKDTEVITIAVTSKDPKEAAVIANEIVDVFRDKIYSIMNIENVTVLNSAKIPEKKSPLTPGAHRKFRPLLSPPGSPLPADLSHRPHDRPARTRNHKYCDTPSEPCSDPY